MTAARYIHGADPREQSRLATLNSLINTPALAELALKGGESILDMGSGLGQFTRAMAAAAGPRGRILGIERDPRQLARAAADPPLPNSAPIEFRAGDALDPPLTQREWGTFDLAHTRFLLEHVPDPARVVRHMVRAVRPGGRVILADDDHETLRFWPEPAPALRLWNAYYRAYHTLGNDPFIGRKLISLLHDAGARPVRNTALFFGACAGAPTFDTIIDNLTGLLDGAAAAIASAGLLGRADIDAGLADITRWRARPDAALWYTINWAEGRVPAAQDTR